jgi:hypothetical protein
MMSSQLGNQSVRGSKRDNCHACYSDLVDDVFAGFFLGYATRARRSHKRGANYLMNSLY